VKPYDPFCQLILTAIRAKLHWRVRACHTAGVDRREGAVETGLGPRARGRKSRASAEAIVRKDMGPPEGDMGLSKKEAAPYQQWVEAAKRLGAAEAKVIAAASVVTGRWVHLKCQFGCGGYGQRLTCPPYSPTPEQTQQMLGEYRVALLVHVPGDGKWKSIKRIVADLEREVFLAGFYKAFALGSGPCDLCETCNLESCEHPRQARPAMEAAGIDVYATARGNGFPIEVVKDRSCPQNYYGLVLIE